MDDAEEIHMLLRNTLHELGLGQLSRPMIPEC